MADSQTAKRSDHGGNGAPPSIKAWILAARPKTLPAAIVPVWVGSMPALFIPGDYRFSWLLFACTLASCLCIQIATNLFNDAIDHAKGADSDKRLGPVRATASGLLSPRSVIIGALSFCLVAALFGLVLIQARGWAVLAIGLVSLIMAFAYTGGPFPLAYRGMGEVFVILFFGFVAVGGSWFVQTGEMPTGPIWLAGLQVGLYSSVLIAINNLRDVDEDRESGKRTLAVQFGVQFARWEIAAFCFLPLAAGFGWIAFGSNAAAVFPLILLSFATEISYQIAKTEPGRIYNRYLVLSALQLLGFAVLLTIGLAVSHS